MSKNVSIKEGDRARNFGPTAKIKTDLQAGGSCYWVPEDERETGHIFASENREYTPDEINKYGIDSIDVNIIFTGTTIDGDPWSVTIDPDTGLPIIDIDDVEITIDDVTGDIDISTPDIDITIDDADLDDFGIDPDADIDISIDDLGNVEISDGDISIDFDPETSEWETEDCPASIQIMHVPNKTSYEDGDAIDLDGLVIQAYDANGNPWSSSKYPDGYIPAHDLNVSQKYADYNSGSTEYDIPDYSDNISSITSNGSISQLINNETSSHAEEVDEEHRESYDESSQDIINGLPSGYDGSVGYVWSRELPEMRGSGFTMYPVLTIFLFDTLPAQVQPKVAYPGTKYVYRFIWSYTGEAVYWGPSVKRTSRYLFHGEKDGEKSTINMTATGRKTNKYDVSWTSPCFETFNSSFNYSVNPPSDHGGSHHSGKF